MAARVDVTSLDRQVEKLAEEFVLDVETGEICFLVLLLVGRDGKLQAQKANLSHLCAKDVFLITGHVASEHIKVKAEILAASFDQPVSLLALIRVRGRLFIWKVF